MSFLNDLLGGMPPILVYVVVGVLVAAESAIVAGLVLPAATALIALGLLANAGTVRIGPALLVAVLAALAGGTAAFHSGRRRGPRLRTTRLGRWIGEKRWHRAERLFARYGGRAVFLGQWIVGARTLIPRLAAMNGVPYRRFAAWHAPAAIAWSLWMVGASYLAGASYDLLVARAGHAGGALAVLAAIIVGLILAGRWVGRHPRPMHALVGMVRPRTAATFRSGPGPRALEAASAEAALGGATSAEAATAKAASANRVASFSGRVAAWRPRPATVVDLALSVMALFGLAALLVVVVPVVVRFSGLADADAAIGGWARGEWTSDGYLFALDAAMFADPGVLFAVAVLVSVGRWLLRRWRGESEGLLMAVGPVLPVVVLAAAISWATPPSWEVWETPTSVVFPPVSEFDGYIPFEAAGPIASMAAGHTAQLAAAVGLLAWMLAAHLPWKWRVAVWTGAAIYVTVGAGSWVYLGWSRTSETIAAVLIGAAWAALNGAIWTSPRKRPAPEPVAPAPALADSLAVR
ncbi:VTT domain-containing protein [Actinoplanes sp. CA-030573]|uniref:VTT domain-containing protein n=1 Tax=Actinoplanes sp. CA-030573 TaxID=3239898 RepID=UPI003D8D5E74